MINQLKRVLLDTNIFIDNDFLDKYVELIVSNANTKKVIGKTQSHHIIPKYYFKFNNLKVDNSNSNRVNLYYKDHLTAHYFMAKCSIDKECVGRNALSIKYLLNGSSLESFNIDDIDWDSIEFIYKCGREYTYKTTHTPSINKKVSSALIGRISPNKGNIKNVEKRSKVNPNAKNKKLSEIAHNRTKEKNSFYGKKHSNETKKIISMKNSKPVVMRDISTLKEIKRFSSITSATKYLIENKIATSSSIPNRISRVCNDDRDNLCAYGFNWRFVNKV